jgi:hypothetical protein
MSTKNPFVSALLACLVIPYVLTGHAAGGEYFPYREGFTTEFNVVIKRGDETKERVMQFALGPKEKLNGVDAITVIVAGKGRNEFTTQSKTFYDENQQGVKEIARQGTEDNNPKILDDSWPLKYPLAPGATWTSNGELFLRDERVPARFECVIQTMEDLVTVPAGTFKRCVKIKKSFDGDVSLASHGGQLRVKAESYLWYAPCIGFIKGSYIARCSDPRLDAELLMEMTSYKN